MELGSRVGQFHLLLGSTAVEPIKAVREWSDINTRRRAGEWERAYIKVFRNNPNVGPLIMRDIGISAGQELISVYVQGVEYRGSKFSV